MIMEREVSGGGEPWALFDIDPVTAPGRAPDGHQVNPALAADQPLPAVGLVRRLLFGHDEAHSGLWTPSSTFSVSNSPVMDALEDLMALGLVSSANKIEAHLAEKTPTGSILLVGGPVVNVYSRAILGSGGGSPLFELVDPEAQSPLRWTFDLASPRPLVADLEEVEGQPDWAVLEAGRSLARPKIRTIF